LQLHESPRSRGSEAIHDAAQHYRNKLAFETDAWDVNELLCQGVNIVLVDARSEAAFAHEHIPQATNHPHRKISQQSTASCDRSALYVAYCDGVGCNASTKAALKLAELGFQVKELIGGIEWWKRDGYPVATALVAISASA
jgi:rhodanese-related sulfurtransferase